MLVSILAENTFKVGNKVFKVGDEVPVEGIPDIEVPPNFKLSVQDAIANIRAINLQVMSIKQKVIDHLHLKPDVEYDDEISVTCWIYSNLLRDFIYMCDLVMKAAEKFYGGQLPMTMEGELGKLKVRAPRPGETLNWVRSQIKESMKYTRLEPIRDLAVGTGLKPEEVNIPLEDITKNNLSIVNASCGAIPPEKIMESAEATIQKTQHFKFPMALIVSGMGKTYFVDIREYFERQPQRPPAAIASHMNKALSFIKTNVTDVIQLAYVFSGEIPSAKTFGIHVGIVGKAGSSHIMKIAKDGKYEEVSSGPGTELPKEIEEAMMKALA